MLAGNGTRIVVADSNRFQAKGATANLAVLNVRAALAGRRALLGLIPHAHTLLVGDFQSDRVQTIDVRGLP